MQITLTIPDQVYHRVEQSALQQEQSLEDFFNLLILQGLTSHIGTRHIWEWIAEQYQQRLKNEDKLTQNSLEILDDLVKCREEIANEIYPE